ncbi:MAG: DUF4347 domain-containing protein [Lyngbya sp. HA4199-MV5]|jgi:uncharacterized delta-60 repeat protein|nr:DUF4347 domain-containing protein [Lyngbya sp. HA4199-MV5]
MKTVSPLGVQTRPVSPVCLTFQPSPSPTTDTMVVIDPCLPNYTHLAAGGVKGTAILILNPRLDGVAQITTALSNHPHLRNLHLVCHGAPGCLYLGDGQLSLETLENHASQLQSWFPHRKSQLFLYGCNVAAGDAGAELIERLQTLTGAAIAASTTPIGHSSLGGNWHLDATTRDMDVAVCFQDDVMQTYPAVLAAGDLDTSFGSGGKVTTSFGASATSYGITLQPDGKILSTGAVGSSSSSVFALTRYNLDGSLDTTFGNGGKVTTDIYTPPTSYPYGNDADGGITVLVQPDGKIVVVGGTTNVQRAAPDYALIRYNSDGSLDSSFGNGGKVTGWIGGYANSVSNAFLQADGKIVVAGDNTYSRSGDFFLVRYNSNGSFDTSFGNVPPPGIGSVSGPAAVITDVNYRDISDDVLQQADGTILVSGISRVDLLSGGIDTMRSLTLLRYGSNAGLDPTFGNGGVVTTSSFIPPNSFAFDDASESRMAVTPDGKIVVIANGSSGSGRSFVLLRFNSNGSLDTSFGTGGRVISSSLTTSSGVAIDATGKIVVTGQSNGDFALIRYNSDGSLDTGFGSSGKVATDFGTSSDSPSKLVIQADGRIVVTGSANGSFALARYDGSSGVSPVNNVPTDIAFRGRTFIPENVPVTPIQSAYSVALTLGTTDPDPTDLHTYTLVAGAGDADNTAFIIDGSLLIPTQTFDFETKSSYSIRVRTDDRRGGIFEKALTVAIFDVSDSPVVPNGAPTDLSVSSTTIAENLAANTIVGTLSTVDPDAGDTFTYSFVTGTGSDDNASFDLSANTLRTSQAFNFEAKSAYTIRVRTDDGKGGSFEKALTINVLDVNEQPVVTTAIANQTATAGTALRFVLPANPFSDPDAGDALTLSASLANGNALPTWLSFDPTSLTFSGTPTSSNVGTLNLLIKATDRAGLSTATGFNLTVNGSNSNQAPTSLSLSNATIAENLPANAIIGSFTTTDPNVGDTFTYSLVSGTGATDNAAFTIVGNTLRTTRSFNYEAKSTYSVRVRTDDGKGGVLERVFTIRISDANDAPLVTTPLTNQRATVGRAFRYTIPASTFFDEDMAANDDLDWLTLRATLSDGRSLPSWLRFNPSTGVFSGTPTSGTVGSLSIVVKATDTKGASASSSFTLVIQ